MIPEFVEHSLTLLIDTVLCDPVIDSGLVGDGSVMSRSVVVSRSSQPLH